MCRGNTMQYHYHTSSVEDTDEETNLAHNFEKKFSPVVPPGI